MVAQNTLRARKGIQAFYEEDKNQICDYTKTKTDKITDITRLHQFMSSHLI